MTRAKSVSSSADLRGELLDVADRILQRASASGPGHVEVFVEHSDSANLSIEQNDVKGCETDRGLNVGVRIINGGQGFATFNRIDNDSIDDAIADARIIAAAAPADEALRLAEPEACASVDGLFDEELASLPIDDVVSMGTAMVRQASEIDSRLRIDGSMTRSTDICAVRSSSGVAQAERETALTFGLAGMAVDGDDVGAFDHLYDFARQRSSFDAKSIAENFARRALSHLNPRRGPSYRGPVLFSAEAFSNVFLPPLLAWLDGDNVLKGRSRFADKLGARVGSAALQIVDDATVAGGYASECHDREGLPRRRCTLIDDGEPRAFLYDTKTAIRAGTKSTGHAAGGARSLPSIWPTNLFVAPGTTDERKLIKTLNEGVFVGRFAGNVDDISGDFSGVAKCSHAIVDGELAYALSETLISGNVSSLLPRILSLGDRIHRDFSTHCPWVLVDDVEVTSAE